MSSRDYYIKCGPLGSIDTTQMHPVVDEREGWGERERGEKESTGISLHWQRDSLLSALSIVFSYIYWWFYQAKCHH